MSNRNVEYICTVLLAGNSGIGKSTICSTLIGEKGIFKSGPSYGRDHSQQVQYEERNGAVVIDTPGIRNKSIRRKSGEEILKALEYPLQKGYPFSNTIILFAVRIGPDGGIDVDSVVSANIIMDAIQTTLVPFFHLVVNQVEAVTMEAIEMGGTTHRVNFLKTLACFSNPIKTISFIPYEKGLDEGKNKVISSESRIWVCGPNLTNPKKFKGFCQVCRTLEPIRYRQEHLMCLQVDCFGKRFGDMTRQFDKMRRRKSDTKRTLIISENIDDMKCIESKNEDEEEHHCQNIFNNSALSASSSTFSFSYDKLHSIPEGDEEEEEDEKKDEEEKENEKKDEDEKEEKENENDGENENREEDDENPLNFRG